MKILGKIISIIMITLIIFMLTNINVNLWNRNKNLLDKDDDNILQYVLLKGQDSSPITDERTKSVISTINNSGIKTESLTILNANWSRELARNTINSLFLKYYNKIETIIANNDDMAIRDIKALQNCGYNKGNKNIAVVGIDGLQEAKDLIDKSFMPWIIISDPKAFTQGLYNIAINLINNVNPLENTNYKMVNGKILIPSNYQEYIGKDNTLQ